MKAFVIAGGFATRLRPLTDQIPKALVPVAGKPFLYYPLHFLSTQGIKNIVLLVGHQANKIKQEFGNGNKIGLTIDYQVELEPLGTGGALIQAKDLFEENDLVVNGDTYCEFDVQEFKQFHIQNKSDFTIALVEKDQSSSDYGSVNLDSYNQVVDFKEKGVAGKYVSVGCYMVSKRLIQNTVYQKPASLENDLLPMWIDSRTRIFGFKLAGKKFFDIGVLERLNIFQRQMEDERHAH